MAQFYHDRFSIGDYEAIDAPSRNMNLINLQKYFSDMSHAKEHLTSLLFMKLSLPIYDPFL